MKKVFAILISLFLFLAFLDINSVYAKDVSQEKIIKYDTSKVLVSIKKEYSAKRRIYTPDEFSTKLVKSVTPVIYMNDKLKKHKLYNEEDFHDVVILELHHPSEENVDLLLKQLNDNPLVEGASKPQFIYPASTSSFTIPNDPYYSSQYALEKIEAKRLWGIEKGNNNVRIGILDTGINAHPDLLANYNISLSRNFTDDGKGNTDEIGHGTGVAGIIAATTNNSLGVSGMLWNASIISLKIMRKTGPDDQTGSGSTAWIPAAIQYAMENGINILNASFTFDEYDAEIYRMISAYEGLIVAAAGNFGNSELKYPAAYTCNNIISVASTNSNDTLASDSTFGSHVDLAAPGVGIYSTWLNNTYKYFYGTSVAAPYVTAVVAIIASLGADYSFLEIKNLILENVDTISSLSTKVQTSGRLNAFKAVLDASSLKMGDLNFDLQVTANDARIALRYSTGLETLSTLQLVLGDIDVDGDVDAADASAIMNMSVDL